MRKKNNLASISKARGQKQRSVSLGITGQASENSRQTSERPHLKEKRDGGKKKGGGLRKTPAPILTCMDKNTYMDTHRHRHTGTHGYTWGWRQTDRQTDRLEKYHILCGVEPQENVMQCLAHSRNQ